MNENLQLDKVINTSRAEEILEVIMAYARLDFEPQTKIVGDNNLFDAIGAGVNMLGEELKMSTVSLLEKEQLLKEVHHRVKNNLQIIISLINLQAELITDDVNRESLNGFKNRIKSMALVHEMLYSSANISKINLKEYVQNLIQHLSFSSPSFNRKISFQVEIGEDLFFEMDKMTPLGLILNEIISNSLRHAFRGSEGIISITIQRMNEACTVIICDNGIGLPNEFNLKNDAKLGMQLMQILCDQIDSSLKLESRDGVRVEMEF